MPDSDDDDNIRWERTLRRGGGIFYDSGVGAQKGKLTAHNYVIVGELLFTAQLRIKPHRVPPIGTPISGAFSCSKVLAARTDIANEVLPAAVGERREKG